MSKHYEYNAQDRKDSGGNWLKSYGDGSGTKYKTRAAVLWDNIKARLAPGYQNGNYEGCVNSFTSFQEFAEWCQHQQGYLNKDAGRYWQLDKDFLGTGKEYSPESCMFVPAEVNTLANEMGSLGKELPVGVTAYYGKKRTTYKAECKMGGDSIHLGTFQTVQAARAAWLECKTKYTESLIRKWSEYPLIVKGLKNYLQRLQK